MGDNINTSQWAWLAGFVDGEGYIGLNTKGKNSNNDTKYQLTLRIANTHKETMELIGEIFGARVATVIKSTKHENWRDIHYVAVYDKRAEFILHNILPFLITKKNQAINALEFRKTVMLGRNQYSRISDYVEVKLLQAELCQKMRQLNVRGGKAA